jgi:5-methylcytosine-specific restriction endonuclease McrA
MARVFTEAQKLRKKEALRDWRAANPDKVKAANRRSWNNRKERPEVKAANTARMSEWQRENPGRVADRQRLRASRQAGAGTYTEAEWLQQFETYAGRCAYCREPATERDHVMPLCRGGSNTIENIVPACRACNAQKGARSLVQWMRENPLDRWSGLK